MDPVPLAGWVFVVEDFRFGRTAGGPARLGFCPPSRSFELPRIPTTPGSRDLTPPLLTSPSGDHQSPSSGVSSDPQNPLRRISADLAELVAYWDGTLYSFPLPCIARPPLSSLVFFSSAEGLARSFLSYRHGFRDQRRRVRAPPRDSAETSKSVFLEAQHHVVSL